MTEIAHALRNAPNQPGGSNYKNVSILIAVIVKEVRPRHN